MFYDTLLFAHDSYTIRNSESRTVSRTVMGVGCKYYLTVTVCLIRTYILSWRKYLQYVPWVITLCGL